MTAAASVIAVCVNSTPVIPLIKTKGTKTATKTTVVAIIANETCLAPLNAATRGVSLTLFFLQCFLTLQSHHLQQFQWPTLKP